MFSKKKSTTAVAVSCGRKLLMKAMREYAINWRKKINDAVECSTFNIFIQFVSLRSNPTGTKRTWQELRKKYINIV